MKTEASTRFERGRDVQAAPAAIARAAALLQQIGAAQPLGPTIDRYPAPRPALTLTLRSSRIERVLGLRVPDADVPKILEPLGFGVTIEDRSAAARASSPAGYGDASPRPLRGESGRSRTEWNGRSPSFRVDVLREVDLIEE